MSLAATIGSAVSKGIKTTAKVAAKVIASPVTLPIAAVKVVGKAAAATPVGKAIIASPPGKAVSWFAGIVSSVVAFIHTWTTKWSLTDPVKHLCESVMLVVLVVAAICGAYHYGQRVAGSRDTVASLAAAKGCTTKLEAGAAELKRVSEAYAAYQASHPDKASAAAASAVAPAATPVSAPAKKHRIRKAIGSIF